MIADAALAEECSEFRAELAEQIARGQTLTDRQLKTARRIACQVGTEDVDNHPDAPTALLELAEAGDDLYFDAIRLSGELVWDEEERAWGDASDVVQRAARQRGTAE